jgi:hypothetical protein
MNRLKIGLTQVTAQLAGVALLDYTRKLGLDGVEPMIDSDDCDLSWTDAK